MKTYIKGLAFAFVALNLMLAGCGSKEKKEDSLTNAEGAPAVEQSAMSFDPAGSDSGKIPGLKSITFDYDRSTLSAGARKILQANADWLKAKSKVNIQVEGHCDNRGTIEYNLALGERRAKAVKEYLETLGVSGARMSIISYGEEKPVAMGDTESAFSKNRRANFLPLAQ